MPGPNISARAALFVLVSVASAASLAQAPPAGPGIYTCILHGKRLTSDRPIPECSALEQRVLNADGSVKRIVPPTLTADERAEADAREREANAVRVARQEAIRRDRILVARFPNEAVHRAAREAALEDVRKSMRISQTRVQILTAERKPLLDETEFYVKKRWPAKLRAQLDANDAALAAQLTLIQNQQVEVGRINALYDRELARLKKLWAGEPAGGSVAVVPPAAIAPTKAGTK